MASLPPEQQRFKNFIRNRHTAYMRKNAGAPRAQWTDDPIIAKYRFCNVYRKLDRVTVWIDEHWLAPAIAERDLWFQVVAGRLINEPSALEALGSVLPWRPVKFAGVLLGRQQRGEKIRNTAYIVSTNGRPMPFVPYIVEHVLNPLWATRATNRPQQGATLASWGAMMETHMGLGSFLVGQIVADLKYYDPVLQVAPDWKTFVVPGPGSRRGMSRLLGRIGVEKCNDRDFTHGMRLANRLANDEAFDNGWPAVDAQDVQNCLCEWDKHERALHAQGTPKQLYTPYEERS